MASNDFERVTISGTSSFSRKGTQGRKKIFGKKYGQRLFEGDEQKIKNLGYSKNDFVRLATHKFLLDLENNGYTELVTS